jgi:hypothetical protein
MKYKFADRVRLKDGREVPIVEVWDEEHFEVEVSANPAEEYDTITVTPDDIEGLVEPD